MRAEERRGQRKYIMGQRRDGGRAENGAEERTGA